MQTATALDSLLDQIAATKAQLTLLQGRLAGLQDQLTAALDAGDIDPAFSHNDWSFRYSPGKTTTTYSPQAKAAIKGIQESDLASGLATVKTGAPFWTIKAPTI